MKNNLNGEIIYDDGHNHIAAEIDRTDPGEPTIRLECGCNELWLNYDQAQAVLDYLNHNIHMIERGGEDD